MDALRREVPYRGKQHAGLCHSQSRSLDKLDFHFNASLTAVNIAKVKHWVKPPGNERGSFSISNIKTLNHNELMITAFIDKFGINPNTKNNQKYKPSPTTPSTKLTLEK